MTESEGSGGTKGNVGNELEKAANDRDASSEAVEREEQTGGASGGVKGNVGNDQEKTQER